MDEQLLSDDEIKELTKDNDGVENAEEIILTREERDALGEIGNISIGTSATTLYTLLRNKVKITTPNVSITTINSLKNMYPFPFIAVEVSYTKGLSGSNLMIIKEKDAKIIADLMMGGDGTNVDVELDDMRMSAVGEAMNQMMGSAATSLSTMLKKDINISPPELTRINFATDSLKGYFKEDETIVNVSFKMEVGDLLNSEIMQLMPIEFAKYLVEHLYDLSETAPAQENNMDSNIQKENYENKIQKQHKPQKPPTASPPKLQKEKQEKVTISPVQFEVFEEEHTSTDHTSIDLIMDVPLEITVELGRTVKTIKDILEISPGSIVELNKIAGEPVDILVNGKFIAKGEVVVIDDNFGVRITEIVNSVEKVKSLQ